MEISQKVKSLFDLLFTTDFCAEKLVALLEHGEFTSDEISLATLLYIDECTNIAVNHDFEYEDFDEKYAFGENVPGLESSHLFEAISILLQYGLNPNFTDSGTLNGNVMRTMGFVFNGYQTADALALMLEHGGNPNLILDEENLFVDIDLDISWFLGGDVDSRYVADAFMHYWMTLVGYGAKWQNGSEVVETFGDFVVSDFKNHRRYYCGIVHGNETHSWVSFFDKKTNREVARH